MKFLWCFQCMRFFFARGGDIGVLTIIGGASAASEATLSSCQSRFAIIYVGILGRSRLE